MNNKFLVEEILPNILYKEIIQQFEKYNRKDLVSQLKTLYFQTTCECNDLDCGSFYTIEPTYINDERHLVGFGFCWGSVEVFDDKISFIEVFPSRIGSEIKKKLNSCI